MFDFLPEVCRELHGHLVSAYWILLVPFTVLLIILEFFKMPEGQINAGDILKRVAISIILLLSINEVVNVIALIGDGITDKINGVKSLWDLMAEVGQSYEDNSVSWLKFREAVIFILSLCSYIIAYLGVFVANVLIHFVWSVLYVCSPLMILMYVSRSTSFVTTNLYKGLINVVVWKVLWSILAVMLLKLATAPQSGGWDNFLTAILINLCIGISMLFIPFATKSLLTDGMSSAASALAAVPTAATGTLIKGLAVKHGANLAKGSLERGKAAMNNMKKPIAQGLHFAKERLNRSKKAANLPIDESNILRPNFNKGREDDKK